MRAYHLAALVLLTTGCRDLVRELLKEERPSESTNTGSVAPPPPPTPEPWPDDPPPKATVTPTATATAKKAALPATGGTCTNVCEKSLKCMNAYNAQEQQACVTSCQGGKPDPVRLSHLYAMDCKTLVANLQGGGGSGSGGGGAGKQASPCGADQCSTCVWDGSSCYSRVPPFLACDSCCCRPGGPAPRWD